MGENQSSGEQEAYRDRNLAVLMDLKDLSLMKDIDEELEHYSTGVNFGWKESPDEDSDWVIVWRTSPWGQITWHMPRELVEPLDWLPKKDLTWDYSTRDIKNKRIERYIGLRGEEK
jgi:hypothetical protein